MKRTLESHKATELKDAYFRVLLWSSKETKAGKDLFKVILSVKGKPRKTLQTSR